MINRRDIYSTITIKDIKYHAENNKLVLNEYIRDNNLRYQIDRKIDDFIEDFYNRTKNKFKLISPIKNK